MTVKEPRTIKISGEAYKRLRSLSKSEGKPMEEIASATILGSLTATPSAASSDSHGEVYDSKTGKRLFR